MPTKKEIYRSRDDYGWIRVFDDEDKRYLAFSDDDDEQSCCLINKAYLPQHEYSQAMLMVLLFIEPKNCLSLGLGAGSLNHCLHHNLRSLKQQIVELRPAVIDCAKRFFQFPSSKRIHIHCDDALEFLRNDEGKKADIIFSDLYDEHGMQDMQLQPEFLQLCQQRLKNQGWLVLNLWRRQENYSELNMLTELFSDIRSCSTSSGNLLIFASQNKCLLSATELKNRAKQLNATLGFSLTPYLNRLKQISEPAL